MFGIFDHAATQHQSIYIQIPSLHSKDEDNVTRSLAACLHFPPWLDSPPHFRPRNGHGSEKTPRHRQPLLLGTLLGAGR